VKEIDKEIDIEIENDILRPEFEVLKPYFISHIKRKFVDIDIKADFQKGELIALDCHCVDLDNIDREIIESVKFEFIEKRIFTRKYPKELDERLLDINQIQVANEGSSLYDSEGEFLDDLLKNKRYKHYRQLRYLASRHEGQILKLRFVLNPFSFVFLVKEEKRYYVILETLDTEEATYVWYFENDLKGLKRSLNEINENLSVIRNSGRQAFLENIPENFFRILHDYSDDKKGFIIWRDMLEERLI
jgi:hypothetical protein